MLNSSSPYRVLKCDDLKSEEDTSLSGQYTSTVETNALSNAAMSNLDRRVVYNGREKTLRDGDENINNSIQTIDYQIQITYLETERYKKFSVIVYYCLWLESWVRPSSSSSMRVRCGCQLFQCVQLELCSTVRQIEGGPGGPWPPQ